MKILHINSYYILAPLYKNLYDLQNNKMDISVYLPASTKHKSVKKDVGEYTQKSYVFSEIDRPFFFRKQRKILKDIQSKYNIQDFDLMHAHSLFSNGYVSYVLNKKYGIPYVVAVRNSDVNVFFKKVFFLRGLGERILKNASKVIFISKPYKKQLLETYIGADARDAIDAKSVVIPNGIDAYWLNNRFTEEKTFDKRSIRVISVGDIDNNKNQVKTAEACQLLINEGYKVRFKIIGRDNDEQVLNKLKKYDFIEYEGTMRKPELLEEYRKSDIFVMPSIAETFGLVYVEAMTQGLPIIYSENQGFDEQFEEGFVGYHVNPRNEHEIADRIKKALENRRDISRRGVNNVAAYDWATIEESYYLIYKELICTDS